MEEVYCYWRIAIPFFALNSKFEVPMFLRATAAVLMLATLNLSAQANNYPCSKSKRGVDHCSGEKFLCRDGSESSSAQKCTPASLQEFRSQWDFEHSKTRSDQSRPQQHSITSAPIPLMSAPLTSASARIIDGDTIDLAGETFRLEFPCGRRAREALVAMIKGPVSCTVTGHDKYGRSLGYCVSGATDLNGQMVVSGYAMAFVKYNYRYSYGDSTS